MSNRAKVCSLFAGIGGIDLAFKEVGFDIVWANEKDAAACKTYKHNNYDNSSAIMHLSRCG